VDKLPFDQHCLVALVAPRLVYVGGALEDVWADNDSQFLSCAEASKVWRLYGKDGMICPDRLPVCGDVFVDGASVRENPEKVRERIGFLTSELKLEDFFTPNYLFDYFSELHVVDKQTSEQRKERLFKKFGIDKFAEVKVADLSTGMKQKVSLVVSIVHDPDFIIFDEPTNGLDVITAKAVTDFLTDLKNEGKTIIISTHIFSLVEKLCDRVGVIINGKMVTSDTIENVCQGRSLEDVFFDLYKKEIEENA
jgi:sodium transport system ATP-binding protein